MDIFRLPIGEALKALETSRDGLTAEEARRRLLRHGENALRQPKGPSLPSKLLRQFTHFLALLLWVAAGLAFLAEALKPGEGMKALGWAIIAVIVVNALFSFLQEYKVERAVQALRTFLPATAWVVRSGQAHEVPRHTLVPGDVLLLEEGEQVSADARLIEAIALRVDNSPLTGEAEPKRRTTDSAKETVLIEAPNLVFAGTTVLSGRGRAVVYRTGMQTEFGKIAHLAGTVRAGISPLQREIARITHIVALFSAALGGAFFLIGLSLGLGIWTSSIFGIGIIVANVPEGLLPTVTLALAMGGQRMAKRKALIKQLTSVETLGATTVICTDKTGTLTENRMRLDQLYVNGVIVEVRDGFLRVKERTPGSVDVEELGPLPEAITLCNNAKRVRQPDGRPAVAGDPTEVALVEFAIEHGLVHREPPPRMAELPFDADRKRMSTLHWKQGRLVAYVKGAPESVLPLCSRLWVHGTVSSMSAGERRTILAQSQSFASEAYRVLGVAMADIESSTETLEVESIERNLTFLGLVALMDPPHREVPEAVSRCRKAGIRTIMITGDHPLTARAVARKIGLIPGESESCHPFAAVVEGGRLDQMTDKDLQRLLTPARAGEPDPIFARMAPRHKMRIVSLLKDMGEIVAVTGDGVNDAPALKKADIGVAMGVAGTDVAKESAHMILLDDNFTTIVNAIEEGRTVYANIRKFVTYVLASNVPEIVPYLAYGLFPIPLPLTVPQILAVDLGTDMLPALALGAEAPQPGIMELPPRPKTERLLSVPLLLRAYGFLGMIEAAVAMSAFLIFLKASGWAWGAPLEWSDPLYRQATAVTFAAIVVAQVANVFACRSERASILGSGIRTNPFILWGVVVELILLALIVYTPLGHAVFGTDSFPAWIWPLLALGGVVLLLAEEVRKLVVNRFWTAWISKIFH